MSDQNQTLAQFNKHIKHLFDKTLFAGPYDFQDKGQGVFINEAYILNRTQQMFEYTGLPDTITKRNLELLLQVNGFAGIAEVRGELYAFFGGLGGEPDPYYMPTLLTVANPALKFSESLKIDEECVIIPNDSLYIGLMPLISKYATILMESELSFKIAIINSRIIDLISAPDDRTFNSAKKFLEDVEAGKNGVISENSFLDGIKAQPYGSSGNSNNVQSIIEAMQYARGTLFNELGLSANFNMKREALNSAESAINNDILLPLVDNMLESRKLAIEKVNAMFGTNIEVHLASSWEDNQQEIDKVTEAEPEEEEKEEPENVDETEQSLEDDSNDEQRDAGN